MSSEKIHRHISLHSDTANWRYIYYFSFMCKMVKLANVGDQALITAVSDYYTTDLVAYTHTETFYWSNHFCFLYLSNPCSLRTENLTDSMYIFVFQVSSIGILTPNIRGIQCAKNNVTVKRYKHVFSVVIVQRKFCTQSAKCRRPTNTPFHV